MKKTADSKAGMDTSDSKEKLGLWLKEKITVSPGAQGNDSPAGNQVPVLNPGKLAKGFTIK